MWSHFVRVTIFIHGMSPIITARISPVSRYMLRDVICHKTRATILPESRDSGPDGPVVVWSDGPDVVCGPLW